MPAPELITPAQPTAVAAVPAAAAAKPRKKLGKKFVAAGRVYIQATYNNTIVTITDQTGAVIGWSSAGKMGFKGPKKSTPYAATSTVRDLVERVRDVGLKNVEVFVRGVGSGREAAVRALGALGLNITSIKDITPIPHNGCRPPKVRRV
ncbi:MAG: 30S ribosomal protein S11 [Candidatus Kerfeldbacteria bacterium]|nr:30S ribosomal protein S11 [Candidatus Kerfeldbacteria bacterium]